MWRIDRRVFRDFDWLLFLSIVCIPLFGIVVLYSAGYDPERPPPFEFLPDWFHSATAVRQATFFCLGLTSLFVAALFPPIFFARVAYPAYLVTVFLLVLVDIIGITAKGSQRWFSLGGVNLQPSEIAKVGVILGLSRFLSMFPPPPGGYRLQQLIIPGLLIGVPFGLIMQQPDLGTALTVGGIGGLMLLFLGIRTRVLLLLALVGIVGVFVVWEHLHDYQKRRVQTLIDPNADPLGSGYQTLQSAIAVGSGGLTGKGFMRGTQTQNEFIPEHTTDFVFSVLSEEWGFMGAVTVMVLYIHLLYRLLRVVQRSRNLFNSLLVFGVASQLFIHAVINIAMVIGVAPVVGIPLPLFSYGGSSLLFTLTSLGMVLGISARRRVF